MDYLDNTAIVVELQTQLTLNYASNAFFKNVYTVGIVGIDLLC